MTDDANPLHGFYADLLPADDQDPRMAAGSLVDELVLARWAVRQILRTRPDDLRLLVSALGVVVRLVTAGKSLAVDADPVQALLAAALEELGPLGPPATG